jgi:SAM-dependent methyltransferase
MMWFDKKDRRTVFVDKRSEAFRPTGVKFADKDIEVRPDVQADFKALPFSDNIFSLVVFDPPHIIRSSLLGNVTKYYGALPVDWKNELRRGLAECFRVLRPHGILIFKWCESEIPVGEILKLTPRAPLFGHRTGKAAKTHWISFLKSNARHQRQASAIFDHRASGTEVEGSRKLSP